MRDEEKIIQVETFKDFDREPGRDGDEESREGTMSLDGKATDAPITVKDAARFLGDGHELNLSVPLPQGLPEPAMSRTQMATGLQACTPRAGGNACPISPPPCTCLLLFRAPPPSKKIQRILEIFSKKLLHSRIQPIYYDSTVLNPNLSARLFEPQRLREKA